VSGDTVSTSEVSVGAGVGCAGFLGVLLRIGADFTEVGELL